MAVEFNKKRIVCLSQDPKTIFSYGLQVRELISGMRDYQWHVISQQYLFGRPFEDKDLHYITWPHEGEEKRCTTVLKRVLDYTQPTCVFSMGDIHHHAKIPLGKNLQIPWVSWFPWDNHDVPALARAKQVIENPDIRITMSKFSYDLMNDMRIDVDGMIYNIVNTSVFKPLTQEQLNRKKLEKLNPAIKDKKILLFVGRPNWRKNLEFLLGAFKEITRIRDDIMLYLHVDFNDEGVLEKPNLHKLIHGLGLGDKIMYTEENKWTTGIKQEFLNRLYNMSDLYVTPHGGEGFGLPICEAMACGVPFVATDCTSMSEFAGEGKRGLLAKVEKSRRERGVLRPWINIKDFVDKILYLIENNEERKKMGRRGIYWVRQNCSNTKIVPQWRKIFEKLEIPYCSVDQRATVIEWSDKYIPTQQITGELEE